jgi:single-stranded-DNA-specific exonuclease
MKKIIKHRSLPKQIQLPTDLHPVIRRVLAARQVIDIKELDYSLQHLLPYSLLQGIDAAVALLYDALVHQARILIVADYDADGATSCALAVKALRQMGAEKVNFLVPHRDKHGYGLKPAIVEFALTDTFLTQTLKGSAPDLLITVDNGISAIEGVAIAKQYGMRVLVTDHHFAPEQLPDADAIVNPNQPGDQFPSKHLCGVGVIFYVMMALRADLREKQWFSFKKIPQPNLADLLDLVALGTVADVVTLDYNNRILVEQGLRRIRANRCCPGIRALIQVAGFEQKNVVSSDLAFYLGPRLNAAGRMDDMSYGIICLLSENEQMALFHAQLLQTFNQERRQEEAKMQEEAFEMLKQFSDTQTLPMGLCLLEEKWHQGVIGILAARLKDRLHRPVIIFTHDYDKQIIRGSGRSVSGVHIRDILESIATQYPDMIINFGGHAMAAGLSIQAGQFTAFSQAFDAEIRQHLSEDKLQGVIYTDGVLNRNELNLELAEQLRNLAPWGQNFPEPIFDGEFELLERRVLKEKHLKMQVRHLEGGQPIDVIAFNTLDNNWPVDVNRVTLAYKLDVNVFRGFKNLQLRAEYVVNC